MAAIRQAVQYDPGSGYSTPKFSVDVSFPAATLAGSAIVVFAMVSWDMAGKTLSCADSESQTYTGLDTVSSSGDSYQGSFLFPDSVSLSTSDTITATCNDGSDYFAMLAVEVTGVTTSPLVAHNGAYPTSVASGGAISSGNMAGGAGSVIVLALAMSQQNGNGSPHYYPNPGSGFTSYGNYWGFGAATNQGNLIYKVVTGFGTNPATWTNAEGTADDFAANALVLATSGASGAIDEDSDWTMFIQPG